eukprot:jgi/Mesen1/1324/ME000013S00814
MGLSLFEGFLKSTSMILVSEIGDKTFFVAALMAMRHPRRLVLAGALAALWIMTLLSALFGWAAPNLVSRTWTHHGATVLFFVFGLRSLYDGFTHQGGESEELKEVEAQLGCDGSQSPSVAGTMRSPDSKKLYDATNGAFGKDESKSKKAQRRILTRVLSPILLETFSLTFLGEWGDRSQVLVFSCTIYVGRRMQLFDITEYEVELFNQTQPLSQTSAVIMACRPPSCLPAFLPACLSGARFVCVRLEMMLCLSKELHAWG